jgi:hypothetical protein
MPLQPTLLRLRLRPQLFIGSRPHFTSIAERSLQSLSQSGDIIGNPSRKTKSPTSSAGLSSILLGSLLDSSYVAGLRSLLSFYDLEFDLIAFLQTFVALRADRAVVHKYV